MAKNVILDPTPIEVSENATFEDLVKMWPKEHVIRQNPPVGVAKEDWEHIEREYLRHKNKRKK